MNKLGLVRGLLAACSRSIFCSSSFCQPCRGGFWGCTVEVSCQHVRAWVAIKLKIRDMGRDRARAGARQGHRAQILDFGSWVHKGLAPRK